jgi:HEAT repeat protein/predicted Zn-dependent protease
MAAWAALALLALLHLPLSADVIKLRNGQELRGRVRTKDDRVRIELELGGTVIVDRGDIASTVVDAPATATDTQAAVPPELFARMEAREKLYVLLEALGGEKESARQSAQQKIEETGRAALPILRPALAEGSAAQRTHVLRALGAIGDPASVPEIVAILRNAKEKALHTDAVKALAGIGGHDAVPVLTEILTSSKEEAVAMACLRELAELRDPFSAPSIVESLQNAVLRPAAAGAISRWGDPILLLYVLPLLDEGSSEGRQRAANWVIQLVTPAHVLEFTRLLEIEKENTPLWKVRLDGVRRLHSDFPVVGDVELLAAPQAAISNAAYESLHKLQKDKTGRQRQDWQAERDEATRPRLLLLAVGSAGRLPLQDVAEELQNALGAVKLSVEIERKAPVPLAGPEGRPRDARPLLAALDLRQLSDYRSVRIFGVTGAELSMPGCEAALAPTRHGGAIALSLAPLGSGREDALRRARRLALHALARSVGMPACATPTCPASAVNEARDLDAKSPRYCEECLKAFTTHWEIGRDVAAFRYRDAAQKLARLAEEAKSRELRAAAAVLFERALEPTPAIREWKACQGTDKASPTAALIAKRIELLERAEKWLKDKNLTPDTRPRPPRRRPGN